MSFSEWSFKPYCNLLIPLFSSAVGNKIFSFADHEVDFYLPQLVSMYIQMHDVAEVIHPYLVHRWETNQWLETGLMQYFLLSNVYLLPLLPNDRRFMPRQLRLCCSNKRSSFYRRQIWNIGSHKAVRCKFLRVWTHFCSLLEICQQKVKFWSFSITFVIKWTISLSHFIFGGRAAILFTWIDKLV